MYRKRQRRQAAGLVVQSFGESFLGMGRKSTAQPRPAVHIPPKGIGPIDEPNRNDVLCGRGGRINSHEGNIQFRNIVNHRKKDYLSKNTKKLAKAHIAAKIVEDIRTMNPPGRFLKEEASDGFWYDIGDAKAIKKAGQALREDAQGIREELDEVSSGDEDQKKPVAAPSAAAPSGAPAPGFDTNRGSAIAVPIPNSTSAQQLPPYQPYPPQPGSTYAGLPPQGPYGTLPPQTGANAPSPPTYKVPTQFYNQGGPVRSSVMSSKAREAMKLPGTAGHPALVPPASQIAFGRQFTPTERSSGSAGTVSTISGLSGFSGANTSGFRGASERSASLRLSQLSDLTLRSPYGLSRSFSNPDLTDASYAAIISEEINVMGALEGTIGASTQTAATKSSSSSGSSGRALSAALRGRDPFHAHAPTRARTQSGASGMSMASAGSQRSRLSSVMSIGSDSSWMNPYLMSRLSENSGSGGSTSSQAMLTDDQSLRSAMSEVSYDMFALDLAEPSL